MPVDVDAEVLSNTRLSAEYCVIALRAPELATAIQPGQFVMVRATHGETPILRRPYSIFDLLRDPSGAPFGFTLLNKRVGVGSRLLYDAAPGARFCCLGPLGRPFSLVSSPVEAWMVAGGVGLAPFATLTEALAARGTPMRLFYGARSAADLFCLDRFEPFGVSLALTTEDGSLGERGRVVLPLERDLAAAPASREVMLYACGPEAMLAAVGRLAGRFGRPSELAMERQMGCGMGGCYSCVVRVRTADGGSRYARSCIEGPIFKGDDVLWE
ncbi:MAG: dihydroorotate dehydrogenase electron transfer subunit [Acidobacteria bacterium]|nr:MAG: dihydroorotate dehydrogenase electron transfer subunit [Acidobacteriota bacterium]RPJ75978.1 MAG: dihydroorotate dehydrogenase electron transfer subunit [Acidobacteriota bacterium]